MPSRGGTCRTRHVGVPVGYFPVQVRCGVLDHPGLGSFSSSPETDLLNYRKSSHVYHVSHLIWQILTRINGTVTRMVRFLPKRERGWVENGKLPRGNQPLVWPNRREVAINISPEELLTSKSSNLRCVRFHWVCMLRYVDDPMPSAITPTISF